MNPRVVLYAEGGAETGGDHGAQLPTPGFEMYEGQLGVAHILVRRTLADAWGVPSAAIGFVGPLRHKANVIRGTMLLDAEVMRRALTFATRHRRPDFAIVLVDADGDHTRKSRLEAELAGKDLPHVIDCAAQEFESWLIGDPEAVREVFGAVAGPASIEGLDRREAKELLREWAASVGKAERDARVSLATLCDLDRLSSRCASFSVFRQEIRAFASILQK